jgi:hypothetical protein
VENFLRYVLQHDVCPEYNQNVESALQICKQAREEWPALIQLQQDLPGCFNLAAGELFSSVGANEWSFLSFSRPDGFDPKTTFLAVCALRGEVVTLDQFSQGKVEASKEQSYCVEVTAVERAAASIQERFSALRIEGIGYGIEAVGKVFFKPAIIEDEWETLNMPALPTGKDTWVYLEDSLLTNVFPKMKMDITLVELNTGIRFIKTISRIVPSFYTFLPQQMMRHYKQPRDDDRPAPSVQNPEAQEEHSATDMS